jgi:hypothetical protein
MVLVVLSAFLAVASFWSLIGGGGFYLYRAVIFGALAVGVNHWRMSRVGALQRSIKSLLFVDGLLLAALVREYAFPDEGAVESMSTFLTPLLVVSLALTGFVAVMDRAHRQ